MAENQAINHGRRFIDRTGQRFGRLTVVKYAGQRGKKTASYWECLCDCGNTSVVLGSNLGKRTNSCGCIAREDARRKIVKATQARRTHGLSNRTPEYRAWKCMMVRCYNTHRAKYARYGARGIVVCERWRHSFENFLADMGLRPSASHSLDRIDNDGNYCPENCRWATAQEQSRNKSTNRMLSFNGRTASVSEWSETTGLPMRIISDRINKLNWSAELALTTPVHTKFSPKRE